jgi:signal transduction histidine kinase/ligand-binding sensor domain-containing protein
VGTAVFTRSFLRGLASGQVVGVTTRCILAIALSCLRAFALNPDWQIYQYGHRAWKIEDGFLGTNVNALAQDGDGYLWLATNNGLFHFDGVRFTQWNPPDGSQQPTVVLSLLADRDGTLWIGTSDGLLHWNKRNVTRYQQDQQIAVPSLLQHSDGTVWFTQVPLSNATPDVLCSLVHETVVCHHDKDGRLSSDFFLALSRDSFGNMWLGGNTSIVRWKNNSATIYVPNSLKNNRQQQGVQSLALDPDGSLLVGMMKQGAGMGLQHFRNGQWSTVTTPGFDGSQHKIFSLLVDRHQALWIGTYNEGLYRLYQGRADHFTNQNGLSGNTILSLFEDGEGSLWAGTTGGVDQFRDLAVQNFSKTVYPMAEEFDNVVVMRDGSLWVGGSSTLYTLRNDARTFVSFGQSVKDKQVTTIFGDQSGRMWIGLDNTLNLFSNGKFTPVKMTDGHPTGFIVSMAEDTEGRLWALTTGPPRQLLSIDTESLQASQEQPVDASKVASDPRGGLWIGTNTGGILHLAKGALTPLPFAHESKGRVAQLSVLQNGGLLAASEYGLAYAFNHTVHILSAQNGLPCSNINDFVFDGQHNLWLYTRCGLVEVSESHFQRWQNDPSAQIQPRVFDSSDGVRTFFPPFEGAARSSDGRLWFNTMESLGVVDPAHLHLNVIPPPVHIDAIRADFRDYAPAPMVELPPLTRDLEISYNALSFAAPQKIPFRYKLSGFDQDWRDVGARRQAVYSNLRPGTYTFQVVAANNDGLWNSTGDTLKFTILPKFYQTAWFRVVCLLAFLMLLWGGYLLRLQQLKRQYSMRLEERVGERTRIARDLHDTLLQRLHGLMFEFQAARNMFQKRPQEAVLALDEALTGTERAITESQEAIEDLRADVAVDSDIAQLLRRTGEELVGARDAHADSPTFGLTVEGERRNLVPMIRESVFRIARELVRNAFRHAQAHRIEVEILYDNNQFRLRVRDNGKGMDPQVLEKGGRAGHWGLPGVRERAQQIGAKLDIWSETRAGTEVQLAVAASVAYENLPDRSQFRLFRGRQS